MYWLILLVGLKCTSGTLGIQEDCRVWFLNILRREYVPLLLPPFFSSHFFFSALVVVCFFVFVMGLFMTALSDFGSIIICSRLLVAWFLLFVDFISELIYVVSWVIIIIIRGSIPLSIIAFSFIVAVCLSTSTSPWWATELGSVYLDFLCLIFMISWPPIAEVV